MLLNHLNVQGTVFIGGSQEFLVQLVDSGLGDLVGEGPVLRNPKFIDLASSKECAQIFGALMFTTDYHHRQRPLLPAINLPLQKKFRVGDAHPAIPKLDIKPPSMGMKAPVM